MLAFDTRGMRRYFDLQVFKKAAAFGFAHLLIRSKSNVPLQSTFQILLERLAQKGAIYQAQGRLQNARGRPYMLLELRPILNLSLIHI